MPLSPSNSRNIFLRQTSSPEIKSSTVRMCGSINRSKTPPPLHQFKVNVCSTVTSKTSQKPQISIRNISAEYPQRNQSKVIRSADELSTNVSCKTNQRSNKETLNSQEFLDLKYNAYLQTRLMIAHNKNFRKQRENKVANMLEALQTKLLELDSKICKLDVYLGKICFLRHIKTDLEKGILEYRKLNDLMNSSRIDEYIHFLEQDLIVIRLKKFHVPYLRNDIDEVLKHFQNILNDLRRLSNEKTFPLSQLRFSIEKSKCNIREEMNLKNSCERKLEFAEELLCHESYLKSLQT